LKRPKDAAAWPMDLRSHLRLLKTVTVAWIIFVVIGLPDYYTTWPFNKLLYFCVGTYFFVGFYILYKTRDYEGHYLPRVLWVAFYIILPLVIYDFVYIAWILKEPFDLLNKFWFISVFYIVPWVQAFLIYLFLVSKSLKKRYWSILSIVFLILSAAMYYSWSGYSAGFFDHMTTDPELSMLHSALRLSVFGTAASAAVASFYRFVKL